MFTNRLPLAALTVINNPKNLKLQVEQRRAYLTDGVKPTKENVWVYSKVSTPSSSGRAALPNYLGPIINVRRGHPCRIEWINTLSGMAAMPGMAAMQNPPPINVPDMDAGMQPSVGVVAHLHGGKVPHDADGWPLDPVGYVGNPHGFPTSRQYPAYPNDQRAAMLWFHDHAMDNTAPQVHAGLAGVYFIRDQSDDELFRLIGGAAQEIPLVIQDRILGCSAETFDYWAGIPTDSANQNNPPDGYVRPEFLGETIYVNGRPSPFHEVKRAVYRLRILNGSNARTYALALVDPFWFAKHPNTSRSWHSDRLRIIGTEAGLLTKSVALAATDYLLLAPGERVDLLLDLTDPSLQNVDCLRLVNLAVKSALTQADPEGIFQTDALSVISPAAGNETDPSLHNALQMSAANVLQLCIAKGNPASAPQIAAVDQILAKNADGEGFAVASGTLTTMPPNAQVDRNRFVLLMNNALGQSGNNPLTPWKDTQMWELGPVAGAPTSLDGTPALWNLPFSVDTTSTNPAAGAPSGQTAYGVYRETFFDLQQPNPLPSHYPAPATPTFLPKSGTYERWYVANVGNPQPLGNDVVDMHPFHMHLVNFVVLRRWTVDASGNYILSPPRPLDLDGIARHDTVRIQSCELVELLVYFPPGYAGNYVYHCHIVEHEDMGMMLHFRVT